jgi:flagellar FliJ protein
VKRFRWKLQRLLDVKVKQENLKKAQLFALTQKIAEARQNLLMRQRKLRDMLAELAKKQGQERLRQQQIFLKAVTVADEQIKELKKQLQKLETQKKSLTSEMLELRKFRKSLERLREIAKEEYETEVKKFEQNQLDETSSTAFARTMLDNACTAICIDEPVYTASG